MYYLPLQGDQTNFHHLSVKDLVEARDLFHVHLMKKRNVMATAIGRYRIRKSDFNEKGFYQPKKIYPREERTIANSMVTPFSWPCVMVFVKEWEPEEKLINKNDEDNLIPKNIYMPDGRVVPICVIRAPKSEVSNTYVDETNLLFPQNFISGGYPAIIYNQGEKRIASLGCLVTDGNKIFALTNKHVAGKEATEVFTMLNGEEVRIGVSSSKQLGKGEFMKLYPGLQGPNVMVNNDAALIEIDDINQWKTEVFGIGELNEPEDLNTFNITLNLINCKVKAYGAVSKNIEGEIVGLFYRYKSVGGVDYVSDFLIGGRDGADLNIHHGDSGTLWLMEDAKEKCYRPFALHWGQHELMEGASKKAKPYALASSLTNVQRELDLDVVRGWNVDQDYSWGKTGHFKIGNRACDLVSNEKLKKILLKYQDDIGYPDNVLEDPKKIVSHMGEFVPLADVADLVWRNTRKLDESNHFADMDEKHPQVMDNKTLLDLCFKANGTVNDKFIFPHKWLEFYQQMDEADPNLDSAGKIRRRLGALPFRVWQMYDSMVDALKRKSFDEFVCAGGTMSHYVGDACQPLHISFKHHGNNASEKNVHADYEDRMLTNKKNRTELFSGINAFKGKVKKDDLFTSGRNAAKCVLQLMKETYDNLSPDTVIKAWKQSGGDMQALWKKLGKQTINNINNGCLTMAAIWQSAWEEGGGDKLNGTTLTKTITHERFMELYNDKSFVPSIPLDKLELKLDVRPEGRVVKRTVGA